MHKARTILFVIAIAAAILACGLGGAPAASGGSVATIVASTIQALTPASPASTSASREAPTQAGQPTALPGIPVKYQNVSFVIPMGLASDAPPETVAATTEQNGGPWGVAPEHIGFGFDNYGSVTAQHFTVAEIDIYPADDYANQNAGANISLQRLRGILGNPSAQLTNDTLPQVPFFNAASMFAAHTQRLNFANGDGVRMVTQYAQGFVPISNDQTFYHFEGLTSDGKYYIIAVLPIQAPVLQSIIDPNAGTPAGGVPFPGNDSLGTGQVYPNYLAAVSDKLNALPDDQFSPSLATLDALMQSFKVAP